MTPYHQTTASPDGHLLWNGKPYGPHFADEKDAQDFIDAVVAKTGLDPRQQSDAWLEIAARRFVRGKF